MWNLSFSICVWKCDVHSKNWQEKMSKFFRSPQTLTRYLTQSHNHHSPAPPLSPHPPTVISRIPPPQKKYGNSGLRQFYTQEQKLENPPTPKNMGIWDLGSFGLRNKTWNLPHTVNDETFLSRVWTCSQAVEIEFLTNYHCLIMNWIKFVWSI